jgi:hypothetical protein
VNKILTVLCGVGLAALAAVLTYILILKDPAPAQEPPPTRPSPGDVSGNPSPEPVEMKSEGQVVLDSLDTPCGMALQPETGHLFIALKDRIVRVVPGETYVVHDEITGFPTDTYGKGPSYEFGPLGLAFADKNTLIVGDGGQEDGKEIVRIYTVGLQPLPADKVRKADDMASFSTPIPPGEDSFQGEGNFFGVALHGSTVFVTSNGDDSKGWICKLELNLKQPAPLTLIPFIKSKELTDTNAPMGATMSPNGKLVVCQFGSVNGGPDSLLTFYDPVTGKLEKKLKTGLADLISVAYQKRTGQLYGLDFSWAVPGKGGLYRLEPGDDEIKVVCLATLVKPTALAFSPTGQLYVTVIGAETGNGKKSGQLLVFKGL